MKNRSILIVFLLVLVAFLAGWTTARTQKWEYRQTCSETDLNGLGTDGWELVTATSPSEHETCFYLKRSK
jgi:hypothetical protein